jgi:hypothetical protein
MLLLLQLGLRTRYWRQRWIMIRWATSNRNIGSNMGAELQAMKVAPEVTVEATQALEELIKQRIAGACSLLP